MRKIGPWVAVLLGLLAAGCTSADKNLAPCPSARVLADPSELTRFSDGPGRDQTDIAFEATFLRVAGECRYKKNAGDIEVELTVVLDVRKGPANAQNHARFAYFVGLARNAPGAGSEMDILKREAVPVEAAFPTGRIGLIRTDKLEISIPRVEAEDVRNYRLYLGFELTAEELDFNRRKFRR